MTPSAALASLWRSADLPEAALASVALRGADPVLPSSFALGTAAQASIATAALAAAEFWHQRTGRRQPVGVDMRHAAAEFRSERYLRLDGQPPPDPWDRIAGLYPTGDGGWVRLHTNFPHHRDGVLRLLRCAHDRDAVRRALESWQAEAFETAASDAGLCVAALRSFAQWDAHPQGQATAPSPLKIERIGEAPPMPLPDVERPLGGVRVLDLTRIIAGPVAGRTLAAHGADVLLVTAPHLPSIAPLVIDTGRGKRSAALDLRTPDGRSALQDLVREADVFLQGYRPGALTALGFGAEAVATLRPGIIYVSLSAYGDTGPWRGRRGFDSLVQTATGFNVAEAAAAGDAKPRPLPAQALDHASGHLLAFGAMAALHRRAQVGGSWQVSVSLAGTGRWLRRLGRIENGFDCPDPAQADVAGFLEETPSPFGSLTAVRHAAMLSETPAHWAMPPVELGFHAPAWGERG